MQIILDQNEIEQALREHLNTKFRINEGQDITIEMKAGRGENGFTANIDIVPAGTSKPEQGKTLNIAEKIARAPRAAAPTTEDTSSTATAAQAEPTPETAPVADQAGQEAAQNAAGDEAGETANAGTGETQTEQEGAPKPTTGLFANLKKPQNS